MKIIKYSFLLLVAAIAFIACGTGKNGANSASLRTSVGEKLAMKPTVFADSSDYNTRLRLAYFFDEAANQQALGNYDAAYELLMHCKDIDPNAAEVYFALSGYDEGLNSREQAITDIRRAAELSPENSMYQERLAMSYVATKDYADAIKAYEKLYASTPDRTDVLDILMQLYSESKDYDQMLYTVKRMEDADGESEKTVLTKMHIYSMQGKKKEEFRILQNFVSRYPNDLSYQVMMSNWLLQNDDKKKALDILQKVLKDDPANVSAKMTMIDYYRAEKLDSIAEGIEKELLLNTQTSIDTKASIIRGFIDRNEQAGGDSTKVLSLFKTILAEKQKNSDLAELYLAYMSLKKMPQDSIVNGLKLVLSISPDNKAARMELIRMLWGQVDMSEMIDICKSGIEYNPDEIAFYYFLGFAYIQKDKDEEAFEVMRKGVAQAADTSEPELVSDMYSYIGDMLHERGKIDECYAAYDSCLQWKEDNVSCLNNYAYFISEEGGDLSRAEEMSYKTVKAEPKNSMYLDTYAWILFHEKRYAEAQIYIEQAIANDSTGAYIYLEHAGDIYIMLGDKVKATDYWRRALEAGGDAKALERKIKYRKYFPAGK